MARKRNRITADMSKTIAESSPLIKSSKKNMDIDDQTNNVHEINLSDLTKNPFQPRINIDSHSLNDLISSIEVNGLMQPIVITNKQSNGQHTIIAGHRRYEAYKIMGKDKIKATILENKNDKDLAILSLTENLMRENLHPIENAIAIKNILDQKIVESQNKLAEYIGLSKGYVSKMMNILKLPSSMIQLIRTDNYKDINILVLLNKLPSEDIMIEAYNQIKSLNRSEAEKFLKANYFSSPIKKKDIFTLKETKNKIDIVINLKDLDDDKIKYIKSQVSELQNEIINKLEF
jgi:ParB family chromosome partitioning protein